MSEHETGSDGIDLSDPEYYLNRELSKLEFNDRVLSEALDDSNPLLEKTRRSSKNSTAPRVPVSTST